MGDFEQLSDTFKALGLPAAVAVGLAGGVWLLMKALPVLGLGRNGEAGKFRTDLMTEVRRLREEVRGYINKLIECERLHAECTAKTGRIEGELAQIKARLGIRDDEVTG